MFFQQQNQCYIPTLNVYWRVKSRTQKIIRFTLVNRWILTKPYIPNINSSLIIIFICFLPKQSFLSNFLKLNNQNNKDFMIKTDLIEFFFRNDNNHNGIHAHNLNLAFFSTVQFNQMNFIIILIRFIFQLNTQNLLLILLTIC